MRGIHGTVPLPLPPSSEVPPIATSTSKQRPSRGRKRGAQSSRQPTIAFLSYSTGEYDARTFRMAESALDAGYRVRVYSRWHPGQLPREDRGDYELIRVPFDWRLGVPFLREGARRRAAAAMAQLPQSDGTLDEESLEETAEPRGATGAASPDGQRSLPEPRVPGPAGPAGPFGPAARRALEIAGKIRSNPRLVLSIPRRLVSRARRPLARLWRRLVMFPLGARAWAAALESVAEPADIWHGMWAGSLPALIRLRAKHGGRAIYDSRDIFMESRDWARLRRPLRTILQRLERRWAQDVDVVLTVNESYARILEQLLGVPKPRVVMNCQPRWAPPNPAPNLIREALGLGPDVGIALYQGRLQSDRGIEQSMEAILEVPDAVLVLLGFGAWERRLAEQIAAPPYAGRVYLLPAVPPDQLLVWTASADVSVMAIQPSSLNHRWTTPQKLFESLAAGTPVVASDLPGMAEIVGPSRTGLLADPTDPADIAAKIREIVDAPVAERQALRARVIEAGSTRFTWEAQVVTLLELYGQLLGPERLALLGPARGTRRAQRCTS
jgi:glycosyltransferase involved in cell wall biosynthesis